VWKTITILRGWGKGEAVEKKARAEGKKQRNEECKMKNREMRK